MPALSQCVQYADYLKRSRTRLPSMLYDYAVGGSWNETTLARNCEDLAAAVLEQRVARDMSSLDVQGTLLGTPCTLPLALAPVGFAGMYARRGELQAARAAMRFGIPFTLSTLGVCSAEELDAQGLPFWFQLYLTRDRGLTRDLLAKLSALGCSTLIVTVDLPTPGVRYRDSSSGIAAHLSLLGHLSRAFDGVLHPNWLWDVYVQGRPHSFGNLAGSVPAASTFADAWDWIRDNFDTSIDWQDLLEIRRQWPGKLVVKGVMHPDDARKAIEIGCDAIVVSNHGGRQLDGTISTHAALPGIREAAGDHFTLLVDGGVRSGLDLLKMRRAGADGVLIGRAWLAALAAGGEAGVFQMLGQLEHEYRTALILSGAKEFSTGVTA